MKRSISSRLKAEIKSELKEISKATGFRKFALIMRPILLTLGLIFIVIAFRDLYPDCYDTPEGWGCSFQREGVAHKYIHKCEDQGGRFICSHPWFSGGSCFCMYPNEDAGRPCTNSSQCIDKCVMDKDYVTEKYNLSLPGKQEFINCTEYCIGQCAKYDLTVCDWFYELNDDVIQAHTLGIC